MMPMPFPRLAPAPQEWTLAARFSPFQAVTRLAEMQVRMTLAAAELVLALSPLSLAGAVGRRAVTPPRSAPAGSVVPMVRPQVAAVPAPSAPKPVLPKPRPVRSAAQKTARPAAPKLSRPQPKAAAVAPVQVADRKPAVVKAEAVAKAPATAKRAPKPQAVAKPEPKSAAPRPTPAAAPKPAPDPVRPRARRAPAKPSQPFKVEE